MLIVEDRGVANSLEMLLKDKFFVCPSAPDQSLRMIEEHSPDLIILDTELKSGRGLALLEEIKTRIPAATVLALVSNFDRNARRSMELGAYEFIEKPFNPERLMYAVTRGIERAQSLRERERQTPAISEPVVQTIPAHPVKDYEFFRDLSELLAESFPEPMRFFASFLRNLQRGFSLTSVSLFLEQNNVFTFIESSGADREFMEKVRFTRESALARWFTREKRVVVRSPDTSADLLSELDILQSHLVLPLSSRNGRIFGFLSFGRQIIGDFQPEQIRFFGMLTNYLSFLIEDSLLFQENACQREYQRVIFENVPSGILVTDESARIVSLNRHAEKILGTSQQEVAGLPVEHAGAEIAAIIRSSLNSGVPVYRNEIHSPGTGKWLGMSCDFVRDDAGRIRSAIMIFQDLTHIKTLEEKERKVEEERLWTRIAQQLSHEIKNPLVAIKTFACLLPEKAADEEFRTSFFSVVNSEVDRLTGLVEKIARLADDESMIFTATEMDKLVREAAEKFGGRIGVESVGNGAIRGECDTARLKEAFEFIFDFCAQDAGDKGNVRLSYRQLPDGMHIVIEENGNNIPVPEPDDFFVPFSNRFDGIMSLNLAIARKIIERHAGRIVFGITANGSRRFEVHLPQGVSDEKNSGHR